MHDIFCNKFKIKGDQLVKRETDEPIPDDEPIFILRARDRLAVTLLRFYEVLCEEGDATEYQKTKLVSTIMNFRDFARRHPEMMKFPGSTSGKPFVPEGGEK